MEAIYKDLQTQVNNNYLIHEALLWRSPLDSHLPPLLLGSAESLITRNYNYQFGKYVVAQNLMTVIDFKGFRMLAQAKLPITKVTVAWQLLTTRAHFYTAVLMEVTR